MNKIAILAFLMMPAIGLFAWHIFITIPYRRRFIARYPFPSAIRNKLAEKYPHLSEANNNRIIEELRYFLFLVLKHSSEIAMPSRAVDTAWHEFILLTQDYSVFCKQAYGCYLHHVPVTAGNCKRHLKKTKNVWCWSCQEEKLHQELPFRLPRLFAIDDELNIPDGFHYSLADANFPQVMLYQSPRDLQENIHQLLSESAEIQRPAAINMLGRAINSRLCAETYRKRYSSEEFDQLLESIFVYRDLTLAVFGTSHPETIKAEYKNKLGRPNGGGDGGDGCGGGCCGCGGGCGGGC